MKKQIWMTSVLLSLFMAFAPLAEAGRHHRSGARFWGGFAAGAIAGAVTGALLRPPVVVVPSVPAGVRPPVRVHPRRVWIPGEYVVRYRSCGTPYRTWRRGYYRAY